MGVKIIYAIEGSLKNSNYMDLLLFDLTETSLTCRVFSEQP